MKTGFCSANHNCEIVDRVLFQGTAEWAPIDLPEIMRECLRAGCTGLVVYRWSPKPDLFVSGEDRRICDELRVMYPLRFPGQCVECIHAAVAWPVRSIQT